MDHLLKKRLRDYYAARHEAQPNVVFDECFPAGTPRVKAGIGHSIFFGMAASVLLLLAGMLLVGDSGGIRTPTVSHRGEVRQLAGLQEALQASRVLGLSPAQSGTVSEVLAQFAQDAATGNRLNVAEARPALLQSLLENRRLALSDEQALAMTGLLSGWRPGQDGAGGARAVQFDDVSLAHYVADCSTYCHQPGAAALFDQTMLRTYLVACVNSRQTANCAGYTLAGTGPENGLF